MNPTTNNPNGDSPQPQDWAELLSAYVDGELTDVERGAIDSRLVSDADARRLLAEFKAVSTTLHGLPREQTPRDLSEGVLKSAEQRMLSGEQHPATPRRSLGELPSGGMTLGRSPRGWLWAAAAIAAAVLLMVSQRPAQDLQVASVPKAEEAAPRIAGESSVPELRAPADAAAPSPMLADATAREAEPQASAPPQPRRWPGRATHSAAKASPETLVLAVVLVVVLAAGGAAWEGDSAGDPTGPPP